MAAIANLTIDQGATFSSDVTVKDANNNAFNLTGYTASAKMAKGFQSTKTRTPARRATGPLTMLKKKTKTNSSPGWARGPGPGPCPHCVPGNDPEHSVVAR